MVRHSASPWCCSSSTSSHDPKGDVLEFKPRPKKLTGFLPADLGKVPAVLPDPVKEIHAIFWSSVAICFAFVAMTTAMWLRQ